MIKITTTIIYSQINVRIILLKNDNKICFDSILILGFGETKEAKEIVHGAKKKTNKNLGC